MAAKNWRNWFAEIWPTRKRLVLDDYVAIGRLHELFLTDQALRAGVYSDAPDAKDLFEAGVNEGKRRHALEIIKLARATPEQLWKLIETKPREEKP